MCGSDYVGSSDPACYDCGADFPPPPWTAYILPFTLYAVGAALFTWFFLATFA